VTLDLHGIRPAFLPADSVRDIRELKGFRHLFRHAYDLDLDPARVTAAAENATRCVARFNGWCETFLATVRESYRDELGDCHMAEPFAMANDGNPTLGTPFAIAE